MSSVSSSGFTGEYHGHLVRDLEIVHGSIRDNTRGILWLAGDSSLDNKHWIPSTVRAPRVYADVLRPPQTRPDVAYHITRQMERGETKHLAEYAALNCAVEESTVGPRASGTLWPQDELLRDHLAEGDYLCVSVGGNDIALSSTLSTKFNMSMLIYLNSEESIRKGTAWGMSHFVRLFRDNVRSYLRALVSGRRPRAIVVSMIYFPDEKTTGSWADRVLGYLRYNTNPAKLQAAIRAIYERATCEIGDVDGVPVIPLPLFEHLDGKDTHDYVDRVEPSAQGGEKMARAIIEAIDNHLAKEGE